MMRRVLITGVTGYIGSHLARELIRQGVSVYGLAREPWNTTYIGDIADALHLCAYDGTCESIQSAVREAKPDVVFHLATYYARNHSSSEIVAMNDCNILYGNLLLEAMKECGAAAIVYASTVFCHYRQEQYNPLNLYAATKQAFADLMKYYTEACGLKSLTILLSDSYGPGDKRPKLLNLLKQACLENRQMDVSDGTQDYDVLFVSDVVAALIQGGCLLMEQAESSASYQIYSDRCLSLKDSVAVMERVNQIEVPANWGALPAAARANRRAVRVQPLLPGWSPQVSLEDGFKRFWNEKAE